MDFTLKMTDFTLEIVACLRPGLSPYIGSSKYTSHLSETSPEIKLCCLGGGRLCGLTQQLRGADCARKILPGRLVGSSDDDVAVGRLHSLVRCHERVGRAHGLRDLTRSEVDRGLPVRHHNPRLVPAIRERSINCRHVHIHRQTASNTYSDVSRCCPSPLISLARNAPLIPSAPSVPHMISVHGDPTFTGGRPPPSPVTDISPDIA